MKQYKAQADKDRNGKMKRMAGGHADEKADRALVHKMVKPAALSGKAKGGKVKAPRGQASARVGSAPMAGGALSSNAPAPASASQSMGLAAMQQPSYKRGGKVKKHHMTAGSESGVGRLQKIGRKP